MKLSKSLLFIAPAWSPPKLPKYKRNAHKEGGDDEYCFSAIVVASFSYGLIRLTGHQFTLIDLLKYYYKQHFNVLCCSLKEKKIK